MADTTNHTLTAGAWLELVTGPAEAEVMTDSFLLYQYAAAQPAEHPRSNVVGPGERFVAVPADGQSLWVINPNRNVNISVTVDA